MNYSLATNDISHGDKHAILNENGAEIKGHRNVVSGQSADRLTRSQAFAENDTLGNVVENDGVNLIS